MLYRASVADLKEGRINRRYGYIVVVMQYYPRFIKKELIDEYVRELAPNRDLFTDFKAKERSLQDHNQAFLDVNYVERFSLSAAGLSELERVSGLSRDRDVFLVCQCESLERCHGDLLLLKAKQQFGAKIQNPRLDYSLPSV